MQSQMRRLRAAFLRQGGKESGKVSARAVLPRQATAEERGGPTRHAAVTGARGALLALRRDSHRGPKAPVFASTTGSELIRGKLAERVLTPAAIAAGFKTEKMIEREAALKVRPTVTSHTFRHTCASLLFDADRKIKGDQDLESIL
jgi:integrase